MRYINSRFTYLLTYLQGPGQRAYLHVHQMEWIALPPNVSLAVFFFVTFVIKRPSLYFISLTFFSILTVGFLTCVF